MLASPSNCSTYLMLKHTESFASWSFDVGYVNIAACAIYRYAIVVPLAFYFLLPYLRTNASLVLFCCIWGYSLFLFILSSISACHNCSVPLICFFCLFFFFTFLMKKLICTIWNIFSFCWLFQWRHSAKSLYSMLGLTRHVLLLSTSSLVLMGIFQLWCLQQSSSGNLHQSLVLFLRLLLLPRASATSKH